MRQVRLIRQAMALGLRLAALRPHLRPGTEGPDWQGLAALIERQREALAREQQRLRAQDRQLAEVHAEILACMDTAGPQHCDASAA